ncbi:MAG: DUF4440 domain-containing protein [Chloroflexi bacterium]|nr:DUF4440 domain-containing protein [Chloroflexota bacterium]
MIDEKLVQQWLENYVSAWKSYDPQKIRALFSEDAVYRYNPYDAGVQGREEIVAAWLEDRDQPNSFSAEYSPVALTSNTAVANGRSLYYDADRTTIKREYDNIFVLKFDEQGRCSDFCEWFMTPRGQS